MWTTQIDLAAGMPAARAHTGRRAQRFAPLAAVLVLLICAGAHVRADAAAIGTVGLTAGWATFGQAVPQGAAVLGLQVGDLVTQTDIKTRWPDGSIRFAVVTANIPANGSYAIHAGPAPGGTFAPALPDASVDFTIGGVAYAARLPGLPSSDTWLAGSLVHEARSVVAPIASNGSPHPFLRVNFDTRVYNDGRSRVDVSVENVLDLAAAATVTYDVAININGGLAFSRTGVQHFYLTRWRKVFAVGSATFAAVTPDMTPYNVSRALPAYLSQVVNRVDDPNAATYDILDAGALTPDMPAHGGRAELAPYPDWTARYLVHKDPTQLQIVLRNGDLSGSWPVHVREAEGSATSGVGPERLVSLDQRPTLWYDERAQFDIMEDGSPLDFVKGTPLPMREYGSGVPAPGQSLLTPDTAHQPSIAYVPYLLTGDRYYAEEMAFWANYSMMRTYPANGVRGRDGILAYNEVRGYGWALRNMVDAAAYYPDSPVRDYLTRKVEANLQWLDGYAGATLDPAANPFHIMWLGAREPGFISLWEQNYLAYAIDRAAKQGFAGGLAHRDAIARLQLRLFTSDPEYPRTWGAPYLLAVASTPDPWSWDGYSLFTTLAQITAATAFAPDSADRQRDFAGYYGPEARLNLMIAVDQGWPGAQEAYDYLWPFIGVDDAYCTWGTTDLTDLGCRAGWALDFSPADPAPVPSAAAAIETPAPNSTLTSAAQTFTWSAGLGVSAYRLDAGNTAGGTDIHAGAELTTRSELVSELPTDGRTIWIRLSSKIDGVWQFADYAYTAFRSSANHRPVVEPIPPQAGIEEDLVSLPVVASDADNDRLAYSARGLPPGLSIDAASGLITGRLPQADTYRVTVFASDGQAKGTASFVWRVKAPPARITGLVNPGAQTSTEEDLVSLRIGLLLSPGADHALRELRRHPGTFTASNLPPGLSIGPVSGRIHGRIEAHSRGEYAVDVTLTHQTEQFHATFRWNVLKKNHRPHVTNMTAQTSFEKASISLRIDASDPDGDALTFTASGLPRGLTMSPGGLVAGMIAAGAAGEYEVTVTASDGHLSDTDVFHWRVRRSNRAPVASDPAAQSSIEGAAVALAIAASDPDGDALTFTATGLPPHLSINAAGVITGTIAPGCADTYTVKVTVSDGQATDVATFRWKVTQKPAKDRK